MLGLHNEAVDWDLKSRAKPIITSTTYEIQSICDLQEPSSGSLEPELELLPIFCIYYYYITREKMGKLVEEPLWFYSECLAVCHSPLKIKHISSVLSPPFLLTYNFPE